MYLVQVRLVACLREHVSEVLSLPADPSRPQGRMNPQKDDWLGREIVRIIKEMKKPRRICICGAFKKTGERQWDWHKCACGGWMSSLRIVENRSVIEGKADA